MTLYHILSSESVGLENFRFPFKSIISRPKGKEKPTQATTWQWSKVTVGHIAKHVNPIENFERDDEIDMIVALVDYQTDMIRI